MLQRHQGDRDKLIVALTKLRNDETKLEADGEGLNSMVQLLMQASMIGSREGRWAGPPPSPCRRRCRNLSARAFADALRCLLCALPAGRQRGLRHRWAEPGGAAAAEQRTDGRRAGVSGS